MPMDRGLKALLALLLFTVPPAAAGADDFDMTIEGRKVAVVEGEDGRTLTVDGKPVHSAYYVFIDEVLAIDGAKALVGTSSEGGNACEGAPFVLAIAAGGKTRFDGPLDTCSPMTPVREGGRLVFTEPPVPGEEAQSWEWSPAKGFAARAAVPFAPESGKGWAELAAAGIDHPADMLSYAPVAAEAARLLGKDKARFESFVTGLGNAGRKGGLVSGSACIKYDCPENAALLVADPAARRAYFAWKPAGRKIAVAPPVREWPRGPRAELKAWAETWE